MNQDPNTQPAMDGEPAKTFEAEPLDFVPIDSIDQFVAITTRWHAHRVAFLRHMRDLPESTEVEVGGVNVPLVGDIRSGFQLGLNMALSQSGLGVLPFAAEFQEQPQVAGYQAADEGNTPD